MKFKTIEGFSRYEISSVGGVRTIKEKIILWVRAVVARLAHNQEALIGLRKFDSFTRN